MGCSSSKPDESQEVALQGSTGLRNNEESAPVVRKAVTPGAQSQKVPELSRPQDPRPNPPTTIVVESTMGLSAQSREPVGEGRKEDEPIEENKGTTWRRAATKSQESPGPSGRRHKSGNPIDDPPEAKEGMDILHEDEKATIDIVAVHGLASNPDWSWIWQPKYNPPGRDGYPTYWVNWLKDLLPGSLASSKIPSRIMTFNYKSNWKEKAPQQKISSLSGLLLDSVAIERKNATHRPLVFICHSFGGNLVEHAILAATQQSSLHGEIAASTVGVVFLGTPHHGCRAAQFSPIILTFLKPVRITEKRIIEGLKKDAEDLDDRLHEFTRWINHQRVPIVCFYETIVTEFSKYARFLDGISVFSTLLVSTESASILGHHRIKLDKNHSCLNKYYGATDPAYKLVFDQIEQMAQGAAGLISTRKHPRALPTLISVRIDELQKCLQEMNVTDPRIISSQIQFQRGKRVERTCGWILKQKEFCHWQTSDTSEFFRIVGPPGIGKTMLATFIVEYIQSSVQISSGRAFAYFFCDDKAGEDRRMPAAILRSLIWQLLLQNNDLFRHLESEFENHDSAKVFQDVFALCQVLQNMVSDKQAGEVFILIDAFDECDKDTRGEFMAGINTLFSDLLRGSPGRVKLLVTCRPTISDIDAGLGQLGVTLSVYPEKVKNDLKNFIELKTEDLVKRNPGLTQSESRIKQALEAGSGGTFLWVSLMLAEIERSGVLNHQVKKLLQSPLRQLGGIYESILNQIVPARKSAAQFILHCMVASKRPLTKTEMMIAFVTSELPMKGIRNSPVPRQSDLKDYDDILSACSSILIPVHADQGDNATISFCHQSVKDFLLEGSWTTREWYFTSSDHANLVLFEPCLKYLTAQDGLLAECIRGTPEQGLGYVAGWNGGKIPTNHRFKEWTLSAINKDSEYVFLHYVFQMWERHAMSAYPAVTALKDLETAFNDALWLREVWFLWAARYGEVGVLKFLLPFDEDVLSKTDEFGRTAFSWAAGNGHLAAFNYLLATRKVEIDTKDSPNITPLSYAAANGHVQIMEMLFATGEVDIESKARMAWRPLHWAASKGHVDAVKKLLDVGAEVDPKDSYNETPLSLTRNSEVYNLLLSRGAAEIDPGPPIAVSDSDAESLPESFSPLI